MKLLRKIRVSRYNKKARKELYAELNKYKGMKHKVVNTLTLKQAKEMFMPKDFIPGERKEFPPRKIIYAAMWGDILGSVYEGNVMNLEFKQENILTTKSHCTDDSVLTAATLDALISKEDFADVYRKWAKEYPNAGYGNAFYEWFISDRKEGYGSFGNGSAMRVSPCVLFATDIEDVIEKAYQSAIVTHNHIEGIKGAVVTAVCIYMALYGTKEDICKYMKVQYGSEYSNDFSKPATDMVHVGVSCQMTVPFAIKYATIAKSYDDFCYKVIRIGGDTDTACAIGGPIAAILNGFDIDDEIVERYLPDDIINIARQI